MRSHHERIDRVADRVQRHTPQRENRFPPLRRSVLAAVLGLTIATLPACELNTKDRARADGEPSGRDGRVATTVRSEQAGSPGARLVSDTRPAGRVPGSGASAPRSPEPPKPAVPTNVSYSDAEKVFRSGEYGLAAEYFEAYTTRRPDNPWGHYMLGISAWRDGDHARAEAALRRTLEADASHVKGLTNLARVLLEQRKASDALEHIERVVELEPESGEGWRVLGNAYADLGMSDDAVTAYRRALELNHRDAWTMNNLGLLLIREGRYEEALPPLARAVELQPNLARFQNNLGVALERSGHLREAADAYRAALAADSTYAKATVSLERVEARVETATAEPIDLAAVASGFAEEIERWKKEAIGAATLEPEIFSPESFRSVQPMPEISYTVTPTPDSAATDSSAAGSTAPDSIRPSAQAPGSGLQH